MNSCLRRRSGKFLLFLPMVFIVYLSPVFGADMPNVVQGIYSAHVSTVIPDTIRLGKDLKIGIYKLPAFIDAAAKSNQTITLYLNDLAIKGIVPEVDTRTHTLSFRLKRTDDSKENWNQLLGKCLTEWTRNVSVTVGLDKGTTISSDRKVNLSIISATGFIFWLLFLMIVGFIFLRYAYCSAILRNYGPDSPYSLAYTQIAFWFFLVLFSYVFIWLASGEWNSIPDSILVLLGIATGTLLGARVIDDNKLTSLRTKNEELQTQLSALQAQASPPADQVSLLQSQIKTNNDAIVRLLSLKSEGFLNDILNDINGPSIHRLQMVVWTLTFGCIFCFKVYQNLAMPEFSSTQLALIGISSGTYLGFKLPEKH